MSNEEPVTAEKITENIRPAKPTKNKEIKKRSLPLFLKLFGKVYNDYKKSQTNLFTYQIFLNTPSQARLKIHKVLTSASNPSLFASKSNWAI